MKSFKEFLLEWPQNNSATKVMPTAPKFDKEKHLALAKSALAAGDNEMYQHHLKQAKLCGEVKPNKFGTKQERSAFEKADKADRIKAAQEKLFPKREAGTPMSACPSVSTSDPKYKKGATWAGD